MVFSEDRSQRERMCEALDVESLQDIHDRPAQLCASDDNEEHQARPLWQMMNMEHLHWHPDIL